MLNINKISLAIALAVTSQGVFAQEPIELTGKNLTITQIEQVGLGTTQVTISKEGAKRANRGYDVLIGSAKQGMGVYGLTVGVGWNKDQPVFGKDGKLSPELISKSQLFNRDLVYAHSAAVGPFMPKHLVRMSLVIRLNQLLTGHIGVQSSVVEMYKTFINKDITPLIPERGTVGTADILPGAHVALAMIGEWDVLYKGERRNAKDVMQELGIEPLSLMGKDALSIFSHNALAVAYATDVAYRAEHLLKVSPQIVGMSLEGLNGNVSPYLQQTVINRPMPKVKEVAAEVTSMWDGSFLWQEDNERALQDPLAFRGSQWAIASARDELDGLKHLLAIHYNSSDDNPSIVLDAKKARLQSPEAPQVKHYFVDQPNVQGAVFSSSNFEPVQLAVSIEGLNIALAHVSRDAVYRTLKLSDPHFTHLTRFLNGPENHGHGFGAIQKTPVGLYTEIRNLVNPVSLDGMAMAGYIEDTYSNLILASQNSEKIINNSYYILGVELLHNTQAIDLRKMQGTQIGEKTTEILNNYRKVVDFVNRDRPFTEDIEKSKQFVEKL